MEGNDGGTGRMVAGRKVEWLYGWLTGWMDVDGVELRTCSRDASNGEG